MKQEYIFDNYKLIYLFIYISAHFCYLETAKKAHSSTHKTLEHRSSDINIKIKK